MVFGDEHAVVVEQLRHAGHEVMRIRDVGQDIRGHNHIRGAALGSDTPPQISGEELLVTVLDPAGTRFVDLIGRLNGHPGTASDMAEERTVVRADVHDGPATRRQPPG